VRVLGSPGARDGSATTALRHEAQGGEFARATHPLVSLANVSTLKIGAGFVRPRGEACLIIELTASLGRLHGSEVRVS
jgi:hypothetical protein